MRRLFTIISPCLIAACSLLFVIANNLKDRHPEYFKLHFIFFLVISFSDIVIKTAVKRTQFARRSAQKRNVYNIWILESVFLVICFIVG
jgi:hypothetical protein